MVSCNYAFGLSFLIIFKQITADSSLRIVSAEYCGLLRLGLADSNYPGQELHNNDATAFHTA